jgi:hypothetical protein
MEQTPGNSAADSRFTFDPTNKVVGSIDTADGVEAALRDLTSAGFTANDVEVLTDAEAAPQIIVNDAKRELRIHIFDAKQKVPEFYDAPVIARRVEQELQAGHYLVGVSAKTRKRASECALF